MILTKDNLLRFVQQEKAVFPSNVSEAFKTTTLVASAALSELVKQNLIKVTKLKVGSSPYYYDANQKEHLIKIGEQRINEKYKPFFYKLQEHKIISNSQLDANELIATNYIQDFAIPLNINYDNKNLKFWIWYLLDIDSTKNQIINALNSQKKQKIEKTQNLEKFQNHQNSQTSQNSQNLEKSNLNIKNSKFSKTQNLESKNQENKNIEKTQKNEKNQESQKIINKTENIEKLNNQNKTISKNFNQYENPKNLTNYNQEEQIKKKEENNENHETNSENFIENYLKNNNFKIINKIKKSNGIHYDLLLENKFNVYFSSFYFFKKFTETQLINFYISNLKPKIVFGKKIPKKLEKLSKDLENLYLIDL